jgi:hypothetical protein
VSKEPYYVKRLDLDEISVVDSPAQVGASINIVKGNNMENKEVMDALVAEHQALKEEMASLKVKMVAQAAEAVEAIKAEKALRETAKSIDGLPGTEEVLIELCKSASPEMLEALKSASDALKERTKMQGQAELEVEQAEGVDNNKLTLDAYALATLKGISLKAAKEELKGEVQ